MGQAPLAVGTCHCLRRVVLSVHPSVLAVKYDAANQILLNWVPLPYEARREVWGGMPSPGPTNPRSGRSSKSCKHKQVLKRGAERCEGHHQASVNEPTQLAIP
jgi:hypothetical protein